LNPVTDAGIPKKATAAGKTHAYTVEEVALILNALEGVAKGAVALMYFCGLRPGEARGAKWSDYKEDKRALEIAGSVWRRHETRPKTEEHSARAGLRSASQDSCRFTPRVRLRFLDSIWAPD